MVQCSSANKDKESMKSTFYLTFHNSAMRTFVQDTSQSKVHKYCTTEES